MAMVDQFKFTESTQWPGIHFLKLNMLYEDYNLMMVGEIEDLRTLRDTLDAYIKEVDNAS